MNLTLASTSKYRQSLLKKLNLSFDCVAPQTDETPLETEEAPALVERLSLAKARSVADQGAKGLIIGSDQVASLNGRILGKPGDHDNAARQLLDCSGNAVTFYTGLCVLNAATGESKSLIEPFHVHFKALNKHQIEHYLRLEQPYDCAGSFKSEGLGISLFRKLEGRDPNSLVGLPLIGLCELLEAFGVDVLSPEVSQPVD